MKADKRKPKSVYKETSNEQVKAYLPREGDTPPRVVELARLIAEKRLGRRLKYNEVVDHINQDKQDNRPENLRVISRAENNRKEHSKKKS